MPGGRGEAKAPEADAPAPPLGRGSRRGSVEMGGSGSMRDWAASMRLRFTDSKIMKTLLDYRKGRATRRDLEAVLEQHREEMFVDSPEDGNLLHDLIRRGFTRALLQVILPAHPDAVLALEQPRGGAGGGGGGGGESVSLLRRALERQDRELIDGIITATGYLVRRSAELPPAAREALYEAALRLEDWGAALRQYPSLLENPAVRRVLSLQRAPHCVVSDADGSTTDQRSTDRSHRLDLAHDEVRVRGSDTAFPVGFWTHAPKKQERLALWGKAGLQTLFNLAGTRQPKEEGPPDGAPATSGRPSGVNPSSSPQTPSRQEVSYELPPSSPPAMELDSTLMFHEITETSGVEVQAVFLPFPFMLRAGEDSLLRLLCELYERTGKAWLFEMEIVPVILDFKWKSFGRNIYKALLGISLVLALNYSLAVVYTSNLLHSGFYAFGFSVVWRSLVFLNSIPVLLQEAWQCRTQGFVAYIRDTWNALDVLTLSLLYASLAVSFNLPNAHRYFYLLSAFACLLLWFKLLAYLRGFRHTGPLVSMMSQIIIDMRFFLFVLMISVVGFGFCLFLLFQVDLVEDKEVSEVIKTDYGTVFDAFLILFGALNGNWENDALRDAKMSSIAIFVFVLFCLCNTIILLNLLIALMADSFDRVQENALAQGRYEQALSIRQIEAMLAPAVLQDARFFPRYLQILRPKALGKAMALGAGERRNEWTGRLQRIYMKIEQSEKRLGREVGMVLEKINFLEARLGAAAGSSYVGSEGQEQYEAAEGAAAAAEGRGEAPSATAATPLHALAASASASFPAMSHRLMTIRSSYYRPEDEEEDGDEVPLDWDEGGYHSEASSYASSGIGPLPSGGPGSSSGGGMTLTSGMRLPPRIVPTLVPPPIPFLAHASSSSGGGASGGPGRGAAAPAPKRPESTVAMAAVQEMGERLTRLEGKLDALLRLLPPPSAAPAAPAGSAGEEAAGVSEPSPEGSSR